MDKVSALSHPSSHGKLRTEYRIVRADGEVRWISSRGRMLYEAVDGEMKATRLLGTILDITDRRKNEEARRLLAQELNHRVKNLFAMANAMVTLTARTADSPQEMAVALHGRLEALAKAHELIRPAVAEDGPAERETSIAEIVRTILAPHNDQGLPTRIFIDCPPVTVGAKAATSLTLVLHELATNALKYGALSEPDGYIHIACQQAGPTLSFIWQELNGPSIAGQPDSRGFGSQLAHKSIKDQLGGEISYDWRREGLQVALRLPLDQLSQ